MTCELFVGNLNPEVRMRDLENCFGRYGKIERLDLKKNFGFIQFYDRRDAEEAIRKENNRQLLGSVMTVEWAKGSVGDKPVRFRRPQSPPRYNRSRRDRSPLAGSRGAGRDRSPVGRSFQPRDFGSKEDRFNGAPRRQSGGRDFDRAPSFESRPPTRERFPPRDRFSSGDRFSNDRSRPPPMDRVSNRGPPPRENGYSDRRDSFGDRRSFGSGPRRF